MLYLSCIGKAELPSAMVKTVKNGVTQTQNISVQLKPSEIIEKLNLRQPIFSNLCKQGPVFTDL